MIFKEPIVSTGEVNRLMSALSDGGQAFYALNGLIGLARALFLYAISDDYKKKLVVLTNEQDARKLYDEYRSYDRNCFFYPAKDFLFYEADLRSNELTTERIRVIRDILEDKKTTVFTTVEALLGKLPSPESFFSYGLKFKVGENIDLDQVKSRLVSMGYEHSGMVNSPGEYCVRGGILDVFPLTEVLPYRIELWSDEIDSIRRFDFDTQKSVGNVESAEIFPATEELEDASIKNTAVLCDFFDEESLLVLDNPKRLMELAKATHQEFTDSQRNLSDIMESPEVLFEKIGRHKGLAFTGFSESNMPIKIKEQFSIDTKPIVSFNSSIPLLKKEIIRYKRLGFTVVICGQSRTRQKRLYEGLSDDEVECFYVENPSQIEMGPLNRVENGDVKSDTIGSGKVILTVAGLAGGVEFTEARIVYISENDIFGGTFKRRKKKVYKKGDAIESFRDLNVGDHVVHENYGLGIYCGIEKIEQDKIIKDFLKISYAGSDNLYVPVSQLDLITKYSGSESRVKLSSLSGETWKKTKESVRAATMDMARDLVKLYALRQQDRGYAYGPDTAWQREFEEMFPFEETRGQLSAIEDVKKDLMSNKIMDRLICGDVGFGKTEVALRAAFKVVQENKQVVVLVPTTVLAKQHYETFTVRLHDYPVSVGLLSRFRTNAENKETVEKLASGELDIVVGTHRALSADVKFKNLGLLVIDEEQRFGVKHKEKIKQIRNEVDVLSLSATPIPRTLHMSLIGIRDMSLLDEAPLERLPVQTFVFEYDDEMVREAIKRELARGGQVYYVVNRIRQIPDIAAHINELVPEANVVYAHGRMNETKLEDIMSDFVDKQIDVLVSTTIIEIGLDISNVNTIIIHDADNFGLSQLYQLRGRVGRSSRTAYAFLMYRRDKLLKEVAEKRLTAIREFSDLGSGFKIAMRDLEIRGAGNLLGPEQHGHMEAVGYDLYCKLLSNALKAEKGEEVFPDFETAIDIMADAYIPESFIPDEAQKLEIYKRIAIISDDEAEEIMIDELIDRFGDPPPGVISLIHISRLRELAHRTYITKIKQNEANIKIDLLPTAKLNPAGIPAFISARPEIGFNADVKAPAFVGKIKNYKKGMDVIPYLNSLIADMRTNLMEDIDLQGQNEYN